MNFGFAGGGVPFFTSTAASMCGIHRANGVRSAASTMYQHFLPASQRAPRALTASFSAKGVTRLIRMLGIICACSSSKGSTVDSPQPIKHWLSDSTSLLTGLCAMESEGGLLQVNSDAID